jgi:hypothetical protein
MVLPQISARVLRFIEECIDSVPQLEALLIMFDDPGGRWSVADISARTYISHADAVRLLDRLARRELVHSADSGSHFRISLPDEARRALLDEVARTYRANLTHIATFIHRKPPASVKEFARAFDLKREH